MLRFLTPILRERPANIVLLFGEVTGLVAPDCTAGLRVEAV